MLTDMPTSTPIFTLRSGVVTTLDTGASWDGDILLDGQKVLTVAIRPKRQAQLSGPEREIARFERAAAALLPASRSSTHDLVMVLAITEETNITGFNRALLLKDIPGSEPLAMDPALVTAVAA